MDLLLLFLHSTPGIMLRVVLGLVVVAIGTLVIRSKVGFLVAVLGLIPLFAALSGVCLIAPLFGFSFEGYKKTDAKH
jgi:Inner membrane protein YgaP-like, transmembrane domain